MPAHDCTRHAFSDAACMDAGCLDCPAVASRKVTTMLARHQSQTFRINRMALALFLAASAITIGLSAAAAFHRVEAADRMTRT